MTSLAVGSSSRRFTTVLTGFCASLLCAATFTGCAAEPTSLVATPGDGSASIAFTAGADNGAAITNYEYSTNNGGNGGSGWTARNPVSDASPVVISGLNNGTTYQIKLRAINSDGIGAESSAVSVTPAASPAAPTSLVVTPGNRSASIAFTPGSGNGAAITNYEYSTDNGGSWTARSPTSDASPIAITGLTNGTTYQIKLRAINSEGAGAESSAVSVTLGAIFADVGSYPAAITVDSAGNIYTANSGSNNVTKITPGGTPSIIGLSGGTHPNSITVDLAGNIYTANQGSRNVSKITPEGASTVNWGPGGTEVTTGGSPNAITVDSAGNIYTANQGSRNVSKITPDGTSTVNWGPNGAVVTTGTYPQWITVDSSLGNIYIANQNSDNVTKITPAGVSTVNWGPGGAEVTTGKCPYAITVDSAGNLFTANCDPDNVSKITPDGTSTVNWGPGGAEVTTGRAPYAITVDSAGNFFTANIGSDNVTKITPDGTSTVNWGPGGAEVTTGSYPVAITIDSAGNIYTANEGSRNVSKITPTVTNGTPDIFAAPPARPSAPTAAAGGSGSGAATVSVTANPISAVFGTPSSYAVTATQDASKQCVVTSPSSSCSVAGLTIGSAYTFTARATLNSWQTASSAPSNSVTPTPAAAPAAPTSLVASTGNASASIAFTAGSGNGAAITNYEYSTDGGATWVVRSPSSTVSPVVITGLTNGTTYQIKLRAINSAGTSVASSAVSVTPAATPPPPAPKPAKPAVTWASSVKAKTVTAVITPVAGVTYTLTAKSGRKTKKGSCKNVTIKRGKKKLARRSCTIKLAKGTWLASVTPAKGAVKGTANTKRYTFK